jgi:virginiamycin B lyase
MSRAAFAIRRFVSSAAIFALAACAGGGAVPSGTSPLAAPAAAAKGHKLKARLRIRIPKHRRSRRGKHGRYISPATQAIKIDLTGPDGYTLHETAGLTIASNPQNCTSSLASTTCTLTIPGLPPCPTVANCYSAVVATYDTITGCPDTCTASGELSANQSVSFNIAIAQANQINVSLDAVPAAAVIIPDANAGMAGNMASGFGTGKCTGQGSGATFTDHVSVLGADIDGNYILGAGAPEATLASGNTNVVSVATPPPSQPNGFLLTHPQSTAAPIALTATVTPLADSGASAVSTVTSITVNPQICDVVTEFPTSGQAPVSVALGADGAIWFTAIGSNKIGRMTTAGAVSEYAAAVGAVPLNITAGPDGSLWFTDSNNPAVGRITTGGVATEFSTGISGVTAYITAGPDHALWFTEDTLANIGRITTDGSSVTEYGAPSGSAPQGIVAAPDGRLWFTETNASTIGNVTTGGTVNSYPAGIAGARPVAITVGADNNLWYTVEDGSLNGAIGMVTTAGVFEIPPTSLTPATEVAQSVTLGPDGNVWFSQSISGVIGSISTGFGVNQFTLPAGATPYGLATGADGSIWFADPTNHAVGRMQ